MRNYDFRCISCNKIKQISGYSHRTPRGTYCISCAQSLDDVKREVRERRLAARKVGGTA